MYLGSIVIYTLGARCSTKSDAFRGPTQISLPDHCGDNSSPVFFLLDFMIKKLCLCVVLSVCVCAWVNVNVLIVTVYYLDFEYWAEKPNGFHKNDCMQLGSKEMFFLKNMCTQISFDLCTPREPLSISLRNLCVIWIWIRLANLSLCILCAFDCNLCIQYRSRQHCSTHTHWRFEHFTFRPGHCLAIGWTRNNI